MTRRWVVGVFAGMVFLGCARGGQGDVEMGRSAAQGGPTFTSKMRIVPGLAEPLVTTKATTEEEDRALEAATAGRDGAIEPLVAFLAAHPDSGWSAAIHTDLGLAYYRLGYFSKALASYESAWKAGRTATDFRAKTLVDRAVGELAKMHARVGHLTELDALLAQVGDRSIQGGSSELITGAREGAWTMRHNPGISYLCGPKALRNVMEKLGAKPSALAVVDAARSGEHGFTLEQVSALADQAGLKHRLVRRAPGQPVPVPSVINWRLSHYAAIVGKTDRGTYRITDPTFGGDLEISQAAIDEEGSGFFLVPEEAGPRQQLLAMREATPAEARRTYGMGFPNGYSQGNVTNCDEGTAVFSNGQTSGRCSSAVPTGPGQCPVPASAGIGAMCQPTAHAMEVSLSIRDTPVGTAPPIGPPAFITIAYNQREAVEPNGPPANAVSFNVGPQWTLNVLSYVLDNPQSPGATVSRYVPGGGAVSAYTGYDAKTGLFSPESQSSALLSRTPATGMATSYTLTAADGSSLVYAQSDGSTSASTHRRMFLTNIVDVKGNALTLNYDVAVPATPYPDAGATTATTFPRLLTITDVMGALVAGFVYDLPAAPLLVTRIGDGFGRIASIAYDANGRLSSITDVLGISSTVTYDDASTPARPTFVNQLTTPYGTTKFNYGETNSGSAVVTRWLETTDPLGQTDRVEFAEGSTAGGSTGIPAMDETGTSQPVPALAKAATASTPATPGVPLSLSQAAGLLQYRNTFYWNKHVYPLYGTGTTKDYTKAELVHWLHTNNGQYVAATLESVRHPLERRTWYQYTPSQTSAVYEGPAGTYPGQPTTIARVLDDGTTQVRSIVRNGLGKPTLVTDPLGRQTQFVYAANNTDLVQVQQKTSAAAFSTIGSYTYDTLHRPLTFTDASGQTTRYGYNAAGQLQTVTSALGETQTITYDAVGRVVTLLDAKNLPALTLTYDAFNRVATRTDAAAVTLAYAYDAFDRVTSVTYPDATTEVYGYANLDLTSVTDRLGHVTTYTYDANRRLVAVTDPLLQVARYAYYEDGTLKSITDPNGNVTSWNVDIQGRATLKQYPDGTTEAYIYEPSTGRLKSRIDALGQVTTYTYNADDTLASVSYSGSSGTAAPTAPVSYLYDPTFPRRTSMSDGIGTTTYAYYPITTVPALGAGRLQSVTSPVAGAPGVVDTVSYTYDALGRVGVMSVDGAAQSVAYDPLGRLQTVTNALDTFTYAYADETPRPSTVMSVNGPKLNLAYYDPVLRPDQAGLLQQLTYTAGAAAQQLSQFGYEYDVSGNVKSFTESRPGTFVLPHTPPAGAATGMLDGHGAGTYFASPSSPRWGGGGFALGAVATLLAAMAWLVRRRLSFPVGAVALALVAITCGGHSSNGGGQITVYQYDVANRLVAATVAPGTTAPPPATAAQYTYAYDPAGNPVGVVADGKSQTTVYTNTNEIVGGAYDPNGSPKVLADAQYTWDAANRLTSIAAGNKHTAISYDGLGRMVSVVEQISGVTSANHTFLWCGSAMCAEHDNLQVGSPVVKQLFYDGVVEQAKGSYYVRDQLGSVRQLVGGDAAIVAQYSYDPYGKQTKLAGSADSDLGYSGYYHHQASGLDGALLRWYAPQNGTWLNRDPSLEQGGLNLYSFALANPTSRFDAEGLNVIYLNDSGAANGHGHAAFLVGDGFGGWTYFSKNGGPDNTRAHFTSLDEFMRDPVSVRYDGVVELPTTADQDAKIAKYADQHYSDPYSFTSNNCGDLVQSSLAAGGVSVSGTSWGITEPNSQYQSVFQIPGGTSLPSHRVLYPSTPKPPTQTRPAQ